MRLWFTPDSPPVDKKPVKRFAAADWTINFPRGAMASSVAHADERGLMVTAHYLRKGDLVGLIYDSVDRRSHPARARVTAMDYRRCRLSFRWQSEGLIGLDAVNGPTLTIEGRDEAGEAAAWYVRLWNYAVGTPTDARVTLDFDALDGGFGLPSDAKRVFAGSIERMFVSLPPVGFEPGSEALIGTPTEARVTISEISCEGSGSVIERGDAFAPEHGYGACTAYDDMYDLSPDRVVGEVEAAGFRGTINHYVGMSHYPTLRADGLVDASRGMCTAALAWHRDFTCAAKVRGFGVIWSLSCELLDSLCPDGWKQRAHDGLAAATGYSPPSTLVSPASDEAINYLGRVAAELVGLSVEAGLEPMFQVGEPWWWVRGDGAICCYDTNAVAVLGPDSPLIADVRGALDPAQCALLDRAGALLAASTARVFEAAREAVPDTKTHLLVYLPGPLDPAAPEARRANLPVGWARGAADVLQLEDYEWVTSGRRALREAAYRLVDERFGYPRSEQHYLSGFVASADERTQWSSVIEAADEARERGVDQVFIWAMPQWWRDGVTMVGGDEMTGFEDVDFPIAIGAEASVSTSFSTNVVTSASGHEYRNANWQQARLRFDAGPGVRSEAELGELVAFFRARRGPAQAFRFRDPFDHSSANVGVEHSGADQPIGVGDGAATSFPLIKRYGDGEERRITHPVAGTVRVSIDGVERSSGWSLEMGGIVRFEVPPAPGVAIRASYLFDVPVRFAEDRIEVNRATFNAGEAPSVPLIEVRQG